MRLILVPQFPTKMRYQEWWYEEFPKELGFYFTEVVRLGYPPTFIGGPPGSFSPIKASIEFEMSQIQQFMRLELRDDDVLLLNDLSFPGLFAHVLFHKRPKKCFAICHGTSRNRYDYFVKDRAAKWKVETGIAKLFDKVIVASEYHKKKLGWSNVVGITFPLLYDFVPNWESQREGIVCVSRPGLQKVNKRLERLVEKEIGTKIIRLNCQTWDSYYGQLSHFKAMLITSKEETFGYQVFDAIVGGCIPIAPNAYSYPELLSQEYLFNNEKEMIELIWKAFSGRVRQVDSIRPSQFYSKLANLMFK